MRQFQTPLQDATCLRLGQEQGDAKRLLEELRFDHAPVEDEGVPVGYVRTSDLLPDSTARVEGQLLPITTHMIVSGDAPFRDLLRCMNRKFLFVLEGNRLTGFVTPSDATAKRRDRISTCCWPTSRSGWLILSVAISSPLVRR